MAFSVRLVADSYNVEPGQSSPVAVEVTNNSEEQDHFELSVDGLEHHWLAIPVPSFVVAPGETKVERFFLKPPRDSESHAGQFPFIVRARSLESGHAETAQGTLEINPYHHLSIDTTPRKSRVTFFNTTNDFTTTVMNLGNVEQTVQLFANDVEDAFAYEFAEETITLAPGQQQEVNFLATSTSRQAIGSTKIHVVTVSCRNVENPAYAASVQNHIEQRPLFSPASLIAILSVIILATIWILTIPKPPSVSSFTVDQPEILAGQEVNLSWKTQHALSVSLKYGDKELTELSPNSNYKLNLPAAGEYEFIITAHYDERTSNSISRKVLVTALEEAPNPKIERFITDKTTVPTSKNFTINYRVNDAVTYTYLEPVGPIEPRASSISVEADTSPGTKTYTLIARNADGKEVRETLTIKFIQEPQAKIVRFTVTPAEVDPVNNMVTLEWQVASAVRVVLNLNDQQIELDPVSGRRRFEVNEDTTFTLDCYDVDQVKTTQTITVKMNLPTPPDTDPVEDDNPDDDPGTTTAGQDSTGNTTPPRTDPPRR